MRSELRNILLLLPLQIARNTPTCIQMYPASKFLINANQNGGVAGAAADEDDGVFGGAADEENGVVDGGIVARVTIKKLNAPTPGRPPH